VSLSGKREALLTIVIGKKGTGKSFETTKELIDYSRILKRKILILDVNGEYTQFRPITCDDKNINMFSMQPAIEIRRIAPFKKDGVKTLSELKEDLSVLLRCFRGGCLLLEDLTYILGDSLDQEIISAIVVIRHKGTDIITHFQSLGKAGHPKLVANMNLLRYHCVEDSVQYHRNKFVGKIEILKITEAISKNRVESALRMQRDYENKNKDFNTNPKKIKEYEEIYNKYARGYIWINFNNQRISGKFTEQEFRDGVFRYISENKNDTINLELQKINRDGTTSYKNNGEAIAAIEDRLFRTYYGNR
jgi:hypothetical protein